MRRFFRRVSIRTKVLALVMLVTTVALVLASAGLLIWDYYRFRTDIQTELATQARIVLENSTAAMSFDDPDAARETLETLSPNSHILRGCLYTASGTLFAQLARDSGGDPCPPAPPADGRRFGDNLAEVVVSTTVAGRPAGSIFLQSDLEAVTERVAIQSSISSTVLIIVLVFALLLSAVLGRFVSAPIFALAQTARKVSEHHDYSLRARKTTDDELGLLVDAFNGMLGQIERAEQERGGLLQREREANRLKDEFLMTLSHELRTPLNAIQGWTRMLLSKVIPADGVDRALQKIEHNAKAQARLVEDLLEVSRFTTGKFRLERVDVDLVTIARQAIEIVRVDADARHIGIDWRTTVGVAPMKGDGDRLQQVVWNLLSNAVKFSTPGTRVLVTLREDEEMWRLAVEDTGVGIDPAFLPFVFEPFRQADASSTRPFGGLGLGLSIVHRIVTLHGGEVRADSRGTGQGATFTIRLPKITLAAAPEPRAPSMAPPDAHDLAALRVLVVDDDADTREIVTALLTAAGARVDVAPAVTTALELARTNPPDVVISDIAMPNLDGYALLVELHSEGRRPAPRLTIALTAQATAADRERALTAGFDHHVAKPFDPLQLLQLLRELRK